MNQISVNLNHKTGVIKPMHGVVNGPYNDAFPWSDTTEYFKEAAIPFVRLHDTFYPNASEVDISVVFPDFDADPLDPASYDFAKTDLYLQKIKETGAEIRYRLGENIEHHSIKRNTLPPKDPKKWAQICVGILKHYNHGWADGFHYDIRMWEVWEEADNKGHLWNGTEQEFYVLYGETAKALKAADPTIQVGGYGAANVICYLDFAEGFLAYVKEHEIPLDFFSYNGYVNDVDELYKRGVFTRELLDKYGFTDVTIHIAEWNTAGLMKDAGNLFHSGAAKQTEKFRRQYSEMGASFYAANMMKLQDAPVEDAALFAVNCTSEWSCFNYFAYPYQSYNGFAAFGQLYRCGDRVEVTLSEEESPTYCCAGCGEDGKAAVLLSNYDSGAGIYTFEIRGQEDVNYSWELVVSDKTRNMETVCQGAFVGTGFVEYELEAYSIALIRLKAEIR